MLSPVSYVLFLLSMIRCCVTSSDLGTQDGELFSSFDAEEPNNPFHASESLDRTDNREFPEIGLIQSIDQCQYNSNEKFRKMRSKREACPSLHQPFRDNGRSGAEAPSPLPQIVPAAGEYPATVNSVQSPNPDDSLCPPTARYPVCADPVAFPIAPDTLFIHDLSRMQLKYCRASAAPFCQYPGEKFWCCDFAFTSRNEFEPQPLLRIRYPDIGIGCVEQNAG